MFSSENLLLHDSISTLELKNFNVRWYAKEAILTDRALYLYKIRSNYVHDAHCKYDPLLSFDDTCQYMLTVLVLHLYYYLLLIMIERLNLPKYTAQRPKAGASSPYLADLPPMEPPYVVLVEILNSTTSKRKIVACQSEQKA